MALGFYYYKLMHLLINANLFQMKPHKRVELYFIKVRKMQHLVYIIQK